MSIPFEKRVKKMQRLVLGTIVAITAISLVISFSSAPAGEREDDDKPAGTLFKVTVPQREFRQQEAKASAYAVYEFINQYGESITRNIIQAIMDRRLDVRQLPGQRGEELRKKTWEMLVLCQDARMKGLTVSDAEVDAEARVLFGASGLESDAKNENYVAFAQTIFGVPVTTFEAMLRDALLIKKNLALETGGSNAKFAEIYQSLIEESRRARVQVAAIDPERFIQDPRPIGPEAIARYFEGYSCPTHHEE
ncbi:MAG: hypothetical protein HYY16_08485, partial [Planctomycetes bacterium]|nr:hypothetical protein [Planctomycetota bacterium]